MLEQRQLSDAVQQAGRIRVVDRQLSRMLADQRRRHAVPPPGFHERGGAVGDAAPQGRRHGHVGQPFEPHDGDGVQHRHNLLPPREQSGIGHAQGLAGEGRVERNQLRNFFKRNVFVGHQGHQPHGDRRKSGKALQELADDCPSRRTHRSRHGSHQCLIAKTGLDSRVFSRCLQSRRGFDPEQRARVFVRQEIQQPVGALANLADPLVQFGQHEFRGEALPSCR